MSAGQVADTVTNIRGTHVLACAPGGPKLRTSGDAVELIGDAVRVTVRWDDNTKTASISGAFHPGVARKLDVEVSRIGGKLSLSWR